MRKMGLPLRKNEQHFTNRDRGHWPEDERWELIGGNAYPMSAPSTGHQSVHFNLTGALFNFLSGKECRGFSAPCDVFFPRVNEQNEDDVDTVVQPDLVIEILSPSTMRKDLHEKYELYERSGVKEYWVVEPAGRWVQQYVLTPAGEFGVEVTYEKNGTLACQVLQGFTLDVAELFGQPSY